MSPPSQDQVLPRLIVDNPDRIRGRAYVLDHDPLVVGRDSTCGLQLVDPLLSRRHAVLWWAGGHTTVEDLSSTNGTRLNGHRVLGQQILRSGDVLNFGPLEVHYEEPADAATAVSEKGPEASTLATGEGPPAPGHGGRAVPEPQHATARKESAPPERARHQEPPPGPATPPKPPAPPLDVPPPDAPRFAVDQQRAGENLNNIGRDQVNYIWQEDHLQVARRETFFRKIAATRTWARHVLVAGLALALVGSAYLGWEGSNPDVLGNRIQGIAHNAGVVFGVVGAVLLVAGGVVLIRTVIRQRRYEKDEERRLNPHPSPSSG
ncbi:FHA domain-containing protein [Kitasatospora purpeofusca]|uniref:FHA domain-containing protein n=1 Tax=Kitasatospora purpeofusca TaxID=67352 RepID=UPI0036D2910D